MSDQASSPPSDAPNALTDFTPEVVEFIPEPMQAPPGQPPESLLGKRVARARAHFVLNVEALSRLTKLYDDQGRGVSPASLARYESGDASPGAREIRLLCDALGVQAQWLIFGDVGSPGDSKEEQALLSAMKAWAARMVLDTSDGGITSSNLVQWGERQLRAKRLAEARRP
jgi:transcriptional regulator with XRE-family HTH domain